MQIVKLTQGTPEWHAHRRNHWNASDAPAMLGESPYKTRAQLLKEHATGITPDIDAATQARFDAGHRFEELARTATEVQIDESLYPCVGVNGKYSASFDGITMMEDLVFEHKTINDSIRNAENIEQLPLHYKIQMEHQLMVSGAHVCLFVASKWSDNGSECFEHKKLEYKIDLALRQRIVDGWAQFEKDLADYTHEIVEVQAVGTAPETLPALNIQVTGMVTASNIDAFKSNALSVIGAINKDLQTDQDFADAEKAIKWCSGVEDKLTAAKDHALSQTSSIDELFKAIDDISETARQTRLQLEKLVKARKESIRTELVTAGKNQLNEHIKAINADLGVVSMPEIVADFAGAVKGKKTIDSLKNAIDSELANAKIKADGVAREIRSNLKTLDEVGAEHRFLFNDLQTIITKPADDFSNVVKMRVSEHQQVEAKRQEAEREKIRAEEQAKAEREAQAKLSTQQAQTSAPATAKTEQTGEATLTIGMINERLGFSVNGEFLSRLGFEPEQVGKFKKYREQDFLEMCARIVRHVYDVQQGFSR